MIESNPDDILHLKAVINELREVRVVSLKQTEVAERMGMDQARVSEFENSKRDDRLMVKTLMCYARAVGKKICFTVEDVQ